MFRRALVVSALLACGPRSDRTRGDIGTSPVVSEEALAPFVVAELGASSVLARDDEYLYWAAAGGIERRRLGGPGAGAVEAVSAATGGHEVTALAVHGGKVYAATDASVIAVPSAGPATAAPEVLTDAYRRVPALAVDDSGVYVSVVTGVVRLAVGAEPIELAGDQTAVTALVLDADHVYWIDRARADVDSESGARGLALAGDGAIRRVEKRGGAVADIAVDQPGPTGVAVRDGRIWWSTEAGVALRSRAAAGEPGPRVELPGAAIAMAADARGVVVIGGGVQRAGLVLEKVDDGQARVLAPIAATYELRSAAPVLAGDWTYAIAQREGSDDHTILAVPRRDHGLRLAVDTDDLVLSLRAHAGTLYVTQRSSSGPRTILARADATDGLLHPLGAPVDGAYQVALGDGSIYYTDHAAIYRLPLRGGSPTRLGTVEHDVFGMAHHDDRVFWIDGQALMAMSTRGGEPSEVARNTYGHGGHSDVDLVFDGEDVYTTSFRPDGPGVYRIRAPGVVTPLWTSSRTDGGYPGPALVRAGDQLYFVVDETNVHAVGLDGRNPREVRAFPGSVVVDLVEGNGLIYVLVTRDDESQVIRINPGAADALIVMRWPTAYGGERALLTADDRGAYLYVDRFGGIVRIAHDATGVPAATAAR